MKPRQSSRPNPASGGKMIYAVNQARIRIIGPTAAGGFVVEFCKHTGGRLCLVIPPNADNDVLSYFQARMPYGLCVPDLDEAAPSEPAHRKDPGSLG